MGGAFAAIVTRTATAVVALTLMAGGAHGADQIHPAALRQSTPPPPPVPSSVDCVRAQAPQTRYCIVRPLHYQPSLLLTMSCSSVLFTGGVSWQLVPGKGGCADDGNSAWEGRQTLEECEATCRAHNFLTWVTKISRV